MHPAILYSEAKHLHVTLGADATLQAHPTRRGWKGQQIHKEKAWILAELPDGRVPLLHIPRPLDGSAPYHSLPAGGRARYENWQATAVRELAEETGYRLQRVLAESPVLHYTAHETTPRGMRQLRVRARAYQAFATGNPAQARLTPKEQQAGMHTVVVPPDEAIALLRATVATRGSINAVLMHALAVEAWAGAAAVPQPAGRAGE